MTRRLSELRRSLVIGGVLVGVAVLMAAPASTSEPVTAENAWVPWAPAAVKVHAGYMTIINRGGGGYYVVGADSPDYERVEMHRSSIKDSMSEMQAVDQVAIPANGRVVFEPASLHLMLIGPKRAYAVGDRVRIVLRLRGGEQIVVFAVVRRRASSADHSHHDHSQHGGAR